MSKYRDGARVRRVYDRAQTPSQRLGASGILSPATRGDLAARYQRLNPLRLRREQRASDFQWEASRFRRSRPSQRV